MDVEELGPTDVTGIVNVLAKIVCDGGGYRRLVSKT